MVGGELWIIIPAMLAALGGIGIGIWSNYNTIQSNKLTKKQINSQLRPWILIQEPEDHQIIGDGGIVPLDVFHNFSEKEKEKFNAKIAYITIYYKNIGALPTKNAIVKSIGYGKKIDSESKVYDESEYAILPTEEKLIHFKIPANDFFKSNKNYPFFAGITITYKIDDEKDSQIQEIGKIWGIHYGGYFTEKTWMK